MGNASLLQGFFDGRPGINGTSFPNQPGTNPPVTDSFGCRIWSPGEYSSPPSLDSQSYNYFRSGDYYFNDIGNWNISSAFTLFGYPGATGPGIDGFKPSDTFANNPCNNAWTTDVDQSGATLYLGGNTQITVDQNSTFEVSGRERSGQNIAVQALATNGGGPDLQRRRRRAHRRRRRQRTHRRRIRERQQLPHPGGDQAC